MWKPYKEMSELFFKNVAFVVDKYHWTRQGIWAFESIRKGEQKSLVYLKENISKGLKAF